MESTFSLFPLFRTHHVFAWPRTDSQPIDVAFLPGTKELLSSIYVTESGPSPSLPYAHFEPTCLFGRNDIRHRIESIKLQGVHGSYLPSNTIVYVCGSPTTLIAVRFFPFYFSYPFIVSFIYQYWAYLLQTS